MRPIEQFPETQPGLEVEITRLYESTHDLHGFSHYFQRKSGKSKLPPERAALLDGLVDQIYATLETIKAVKSDGKHKAQKSLAFNAFDNAANGIYNPAGWVESEIVGDEGRGDYAAVIDLAERIRFYTDVGVEVFEGIVENSQDMGEIAVERGVIVFKGLVLDALKNKLKFEAAIYNGMKKIYGVTVSIPSLDKSQVA